MRKTAFLLLPICCFQLDILLFTYVEGSRSFLLKPVISELHDGSCTIILGELSAMENSIRVLWDYGYALVNYEMKNFSESADTASLLIKMLEQNCGVFVLSSTNVCNVFGAIYQANKFSIQRKIRKFLITLDNSSIQITNDVLQCKWMNYFPYTYVMRPAIHCQNSNCSEYQIISHTLGDDLRPMSFEVISPFKSCGVLENKNELKKDKMNNLNGLTMKLLDFPYSPYTIVNGTFYDGFDYRTMMEFSKQRNFSWDVEVIDTNYGDPADNETSGSYYGSLKRFTYHMGITGVYILDVYSKVFDISNVYIQSDIIFLTPPGKRIENIWSIFAPLTLEVWFCVIMTVVLISIFLCLFSYVLHLLYRNSTVPYSDYAYSLMYSVGMLVGLGVLDETEFIVIRQVIFWSVIHTILILTAYTSNLVSFLTFPRYELPVDTLQQFVDTKLIWGTDDIVWVSILEASSDMLVKTISHRVQLIENDYDRLNKLAKQGKIALLAEKLPTGLVCNVDFLDKTTLAKMHLMSESSLSSPIGYPFHKGSPFVASFNSFLKVLRDSGIIGHWERELGYGTTTGGDNGDGEEELRPLVVSDIGGSFIILGVGLGLSLLVFILEVTKDKTIFGYDNVRSINVKI